MSIDLDPTNQLNKLSCELYNLQMLKRTSQGLACKSKVIFDLVTALVLAFVISPVILTIGLLIWLDGGPIFFSHERIGRNGRVFLCLKFRSMVVKPTEVLTKHFEVNAEAAEEWIRCQKLRNDPRVTTIGRFLRATSLDELPQLLNVIKLEMSLVGPRPIVASELPRYGKDISHYYKVRPGLTGLWQISGRSNTTYQERVELDVRYVKNWRFWNDIVILALTIPNVLSRDGAR